MALCAGQHLLEDEELVQTLKETTCMAAEVKERLQKTFETKESILLSRLKYEKVMRILRVTCTSGYRTRAHYSLPYGDNTGDCQPRLFEAFSTHN